jgi:hypothetical protein
MSERLQPILAILDQGLSLYRRHFAPFLLLTACWVVPFALVAGLLFAAAAAYNDSWALVVVILLALLLVPLAIYMVGGLSRAAVLAADGQPVRLRQALAIRPARLAGMGCFAFVYLIVAQFVSTIVSLVLICPVYLVGAAGIGGMAALSNSDGVASAIVLVIVTLLFGGAYGFALIIGGATYSGVMYGLQPWVQDARPFGETIQLSLSLIVYRFWRNLATWCLAALLLASVGLTVTLAVGVLIPLPLLWLFGEESPAAQAVAACAWALGLVFVVPPLPIWMALLYRRNRSLYQGAELQAKIDQWAHARGHVLETQGEGL